MARRKKSAKARGNPNYEIPSDWSRELWTFGPKPTYAHWTSYPTYAYQQFYRMNPRPPEWQPGPDIVKCADCGVLATKGSMWGSVCLTCYNQALPELPTWPPKKKSWWSRNNSARRKSHEARRNGEVDVPTSSWSAKAVPWTYAQNAGPFLPEMFPYGQGGRPYVYANPSEYTGSGRRGGFSTAQRESLPTWYFLKPSGRGWPAGDPRRGARDDMHALEVIRYMNRGFGNRSEYPGLIRELARRYSPEDDENRAIWTSYRNALTGILRKSPDMPSMAELRRLG